MADTEMHEPNERGMDEIHQQQDDHDVEQHEPDYMQVEDSQYDELRVSQQIPTKTDDEAVCETQLDEQRPRTAGSTYSGNTDFDITDDGNVINSLVVTRPDGEEAREEANLPFAPSAFLARPMASPDPDTSVNFAFGKASMPAMDFTGKRRGPAAGGKSPGAQATGDDEPTPAPTEDENTRFAVAVEARSPPPNVSYAPTDVADDATSRMPREGVIDDNEQPHISMEVVLEDSEQPLARPEGHQEGEKRKKKKKKKKVRRYNTAPTEPVDPAVPGETPGHTGAQAEGNVVAPTFDNGHHQFVPAHEVIGAYEEAVEPSFRQDTIAEPPSYEEEDGSPHVQLHEHLQAAAPEQDYSADNAELANFVPAEEDPTTYVDEPDPNPDSYTPARFREPSATFESSREAATSQRRSVSRQTSTRSDTSRPRKGKSSTSQRAPELAPMNIPNGDEPSSDLNDYLQVMEYKIQRKEHASKCKFAQEREALQEEARQLAAAKQVLQDDLDGVQQQNASLSQEVQQQRSKLAVYESKVRRFKKFVDGLGNDMDALRKEAALARRQAMELSQDDLDRKNEQAALSERLAHCADKSAQLKNEALKSCQEAQMALHEAQLRSSYLETQLSDKAGLLAEERDRRGQLEQQLLTATNTDKRVLVALKENNDACVEALDEIRGALGDTSQSKQATEMMEKTFAAVQALTSQHSANADDIETVKVAVDLLSESVTAFRDSVDSAKDADHPNMEDVQTNITASIQSLKAELNEQERFIRQEATLRETIKTLETTLEDSKTRVAESKRQLSDAQKRENELREQNEALRTRSTASPSEISSTNEASIQLNEARLELQNKSKALESARAELESKAEELRVLSATNGSLQEQMQDIQRQFDEAQSQIAAFDSERTKLEREFKTEVERVKKEIEGHSNNAFKMSETKRQNEEKSHKSELEKLRSKVQPLEEELAAAKANLEKLTKHNKKALADKEHELEESRNLVQTKSQEMEKLQAALRDMQNGREADAAVKAEYDAVSNQLTAEKARHLETANQRTALAEQLSELQSALEQARASETATKAELDDLKNDSNAALEEKSRQLAEALEAAGTAEAGIEALNQSCKEAISKAEAVCAKRIQDLQIRLDEANQEADAKKDEGEKFRAAVEASWQEEQEVHEAQIADAVRRASEAEAAKAEALAESDVLRTKLAELSQKQAHANQDRLGGETKQHPPASRGSNISTSRIRVPNVRPGITPTANEEFEPPKPRKKADRSTNKVVEEGLAPLPISDVLRRSVSHGKDTSSAEPIVRGPVVEESQPSGTESSRARAAKPTGWTDSSKPATSTFLSDSGGIVDKGSLVSKAVPNASHSRRLPGVVEETQFSVEETQFDENLPSFAALNGTQSFESQPARGLLPKPASTVLRTHGSQHPSTSRMAFNDRSIPVSGSHDFAVYEDSQYTQEPHSVSGSQAYGILQDSLSWTQSQSQSDKDKYTYRKTYPNPNSASKMVRRDSQSTQAAEDQIASAQKAHRSRMQTPEIRGGGDLTRLTQATNSSSPDFVHDVGSSRKLSTYNTPGHSGSAKHHTSKTSSYPAIDPRLAGREPQAALKRKAEAQVVHGYEQERKKRLSGQSKGPAIDTSRLSLRNATQPSIRDLPSIPSSNSGRSNARHSASTSSVRPRSVAGSSMRGSQGYKRTPKNDEYNARFSAELRR